MIRDPATGAVLIRANQGHTMKTVAAEKLLTRLTLADVHTYPYVVHGTTARAWPLIKKTGLNKMERNHIHFAIGLPRDEGVVSGMRGSSAVLVELDLAAVLAAGTIPMFISDNKVILSPGVDGSGGSIPPQYFKSVTNRKTGANLLESGAGSQAVEGPGVTLTGAISVTSFGYKYSDAPPAADIILDCRCLPNPHRVTELRALTGEHIDVQSYVFGSAGKAHAIVKRAVASVQSTVGARGLTVAVGCHGGQHRSVAVTLAISEALSAKGFTVGTEHREKGSWGGGGGGGGGGRGGGAVSWATERTKQPPTQPAAPAPAPAAAGGAGAGAGAVLATEAGLQQPPWRGLTPADLRSIWVTASHARADKKQGVFAFYGHNPAKATHPYFSNFYWQDEPFEFIFPECKCDHTRAFSRALSISLSLSRPLSLSLSLSRARSLSVATSTDTTTYTHHPQHTQHTQHT